MKRWGKKKNKLPAGLVQRIYHVYYKYLFMNNLIHIGYGNDSGH